MSGGPANIATMAGVAAGSGLSPRPPQLTPHQKLDRLEQLIVSTDKPLKAEIIHHFTPGMYAREMRLPAGAILTSRTHKTRHLFVVSKGKLLVWCDDKTVEIAAPFIGITEAGTRRAGRVLEDCIWTTFHPTNLTDVAAIDAEILEPLDTSHLEGLGGERWPQFAKQDQGVLA